MGSCSMSNIHASGPTDGLNEIQRVITCDLTFDVTEHAEIVVQIAAADSAGRVVDERFELASAGSPSLSAVELRNSVGERMHVIRADPGRLSVSYRSQLQAAPQP